MPAPLKLQLCSPEEGPLEHEASEILVPGAGGLFTVLPGHTPLLSTLVPGVVIGYRDDGGEAQFYAVHGGFVEVSGDTVSVLADVMEHAEKIDAERAQAAKTRAEERIQKPADTDIARAEAAYHRALARLQAHGGHHY